MHPVVAVDLTQGQAPLPRGEPPVPGNHDLAATLKALAANSSSFGGSSAAESDNLHPDGIDPEMITRFGHCSSAVAGTPTTACPALPLLLLVHVTEANHHHTLLHRHHHHTVQLIVHGIVGLQCISLRANEVVHMEYMLMLLM